MSASSRPWAFSPCSRSAASLPSSPPVPSRARPCRRPWCCRSTCATCRRRPARPACCAAACSAVLPATSSRPSSSCGQPPTIRVSPASSSISATRMPGSPVSRSFARPSRTSAARANSPSASRPRWAAVERTCPTTTSPPPWTRSGCSRAAVSRSPASPSRRPSSRTASIASACTSRAASATNTRAPPIPSPTTPIRRRPARTSSN